MSDKFFLDTNILVYSFDSTQVKKRKIAQGLIGRALAEGDGLISYSVVQEFLNVATRKFAKPMTERDAQDFLRAVLQPLCRVFASIDLYEHALKLASAYRYSFYDCLILAAANQAGAKILYSEDMQDGQAIEGLRIRNPFQ